MTSMKSPTFALLLAFIPLAAASAADSTPKPTPQRSFLYRMLHPFGESKAKTSEKEIKGAPFKHLGLSMTIEPKVLKLSEIHEFKATVTLINRGAQIVQMDFPTSQRIEVVIKTAAGKLVEQWSEDQAFVNEPSLVAINPNERLEYVASMATRDLTAGESYILEAYFPSYEKMRTQIPLVIEK